MIFHPQKWASSRTAKYFKHKYSGHSCLYGLCILGRGFAQSAKMRIGYKCSFGFQKKCIIPKMSLAEPEAIWGENG